MPKNIVSKGKALIKSKVFWFNMLAGVIAIASLFGFAEFEASPQTVEIISAVVAIINIVLRVKTREPITSIK